MTTVLQGNLLYAPRLGELTARPRAFLVLEDGVVEGVYDALPECFRDVPVEDYGECLMIPSFVDLHLHAPQLPMLGMGMDLPLLDWLNTYTFKTEARFGDAEFARRVCRSLARSLVENGTTRAAVFSSRHTEATWILMEELEWAGVSGYVGKVNMDRNSGEVEETTESSLAETLRWLEGCDFPHVRPMLTPRFTSSCTDELMAFLGKLALERNLPVQSHLSENQGEVAWVKELHSDCGRYWETYDKFGLWKRGTLMAHCVYSDGAEQAAMAESGVWAVHCPTSNLNLCSGHAPVRSMLEEGVNVALGSDIAGGDTLSMPRVAVSAIQVSKVRNMTAGEPFLTVPEAFYLATTAGHRYFGDAPFETDKPLHALVVDDSSLPPPARDLTLEERLERVLYLFTPSLLREVYSEGQKRLQ